MGLVDAPRLLRLLLTAVVAAAQEFESRQGVLDEELARRTATELALLEAEAARKEAEAAAIRCVRDSREALWRIWSCCLHMACLCECVGVWVCGG
jgi:hypothetical protein